MVEEYQGPWKRGQTFQPDSTISFSGMYRKSFFLLGIGPILNKEVEFIYQPDLSDHAYVYI